MRLVCLFVFFIVAVGYSQENVLKGKVLANALLSDILVVNLTQETQVKTDSFGDFQIIASVGDLLVFSSPTLYKKRLLVESSDFKNDLIVEMEAKSIEIEEIQIIRSNITSESLGLVPKNQKRYTPAERRLKTATDMTLIVGFGLGFSLDPIINALSGRTKLLKQELKIERFNQSLALSKMYLTDKLLINEFGIPEKYVNDFRVYLIDSSDFLQILKSKNQTQIVTMAFTKLEEYKKVTVYED